MSSGTTTVGVVKYDAIIDLPQLKSSLAEADKLVQKSYDNQAKAAKSAAKASSSPGSTSGGTATSDAEARVAAIKKEAQDTVTALSKYAPQVQKQFLTVQRANNQVASATDRSTAAIQKYGEGSVQASAASRSLGVAIQNQSQQQNKLNAMLDGSNEKTSNFSGGLYKSLAVFGTVTAAIYTVRQALSVFGSAVQAANQYQASLTGLSRLSERFGYDQNLATQAAQDLASDGLITVATAAQGLQTLLNAGVGLPQAIQLMKGYKDQAAFGRSSTIDFDTAVGNLAESFYTENSTIGNLSGQTENWNQILEYGASVMGKNVDQLSASERVQAKLIGQQKLNNVVQGDAAVYAETNAGKQAELNAVLKEVQQTIGGLINEISGGLIGALGGMSKGTQDSIISWGAGLVTFSAFVFLVPKIISGIKAIIATMKTLTIASALSSGGLTVLLGVLAGVAASSYIDQLTQGLDDADTSADSAAGSINQMDAGLSTASDNAKDVAKQLKKISEEAQQANDDYRYSLAQLIQQKNEDIASLTKTLADEKKEYDDSYNERLASFNKSQNDELVSHQEKVRALQSQIDFLTKYNSAANNKQVADLKFALAQENAQYQQSTQDAQDEFDTQTQSAKDQYEEQRQEHQKELDADLALLQQHRQDVLDVQNVMVLDEIDSLKKQRDAQLQSLQEQRQDIIDTLTDAGSTAGTNAADAFNKAFGAEGIYFDTATNYKVQKVKGQTIVTPEFATGGFTGSGGKYDVAGVVHAGEYVLPQEQVNQATGQPDWSKIGGGSQSVVVNLSLAGIMTSTKSDERAIAKRMAKLINEAVKSKTGKPAIVGV